MPRTGFCSTCRTRWYFTRDVAYPQWRVECPSKKCRGKRLVPVTDFSNKGDGARPHPDPALWIKKKPVVIPDRQHGFDVFAVELEPAAETTAQTQNVRRVERATEKRKEKTMKITRKADDAATTPVKTEPKSKSKVKSKSKSKAKPAPRKVKVTKLPAKGKARVKKNVKPIFPKKGAIAKKSKDGDGPAAIIRKAFARSRTVKLEDLMKACDMDRKGVHCMLAGLAKAKNEDKRVVASYDRATQSYTLKK